MNGLRAGRQVVEVVVRDSVRVRTDRLNGTIRLLASVLEHFGVFARGRAMGLKGVASINLVPDSLDRHRFGRRGRCTSHTDADDVLVWMLCLDADNLVCCHVYLVSLNHPDVDAICTVDPHRHASLRRTIEPWKRRQSRIWTSGSPFWATTPKRLRKPSLSPAPTKNLTAQRPKELASNGLVGESSGHSRSEVSHALSIGQLAGAVSVVELVQVPVQVFSAHGVARSIKRTLQLTKEIFRLVRPVTFLGYSRALKVTQRTAWFMLHRIRDAMEARSIVQLTGIVEVDETFIGGAAKNMHESTRRRRTIGGGRKVPVQGARQREGP